MMPPVRPDTPSIATPSGVTLSPMAQRIALPVAAPAAKPTAPPPMMAPGPVQEKSAAAPSPARAPTPHEAREMATSFSAPLLHFQAVSYQARSLLASLMSPH